MKSMAYLVLLVLVLSGCRGARDEVKPNTDRPPLIVEVPVPHYVQIPDTLLRDCLWRRSAPLEAMPAVARERRKCLEVYEADREAIRKVRGGPVAEPRGESP